MSSDVKGKSAGAGANFTITKYWGNVDADLRADPVVQKVLPCRLGPGAGKLKAAPSG